MDHEETILCNVVVVVVVVVVVLYSPNTNRYITDTCKTNNSIKHIWQVAREALVLHLQDPVITINLNHLQFSYSSLFVGENVNLKMFVICFRGGIGVKDGGIGERVQ